MSRGAILGTSLLLLSVLSCEAGFLRRINDDRSVKGRHHGLGLQLLSKLFQSTDCDWCDTVMTKVTTHFEKETVHHEIIEDFKGICDDGLPRIIRPACRIAIGQFGFEIVDYILKTLRPNTSCVIAGLCPDPTPPFGTQSGFLATVRRFMSPIHQADDPCKKCHFVLNAVITNLDEQTTPEIKTAIEQDVCSQIWLIGPLKTLCFTVADPFVTQALDIIKKKLDPTILCFQINMCVAP